jgi:hypothetical protein
VERYQFDSLTRLLNGALLRRHLLRGLAGLGLGLAAMHRVGIAEARQKRTRKVKPNAFGCLNVGDPCKRDTQCCSGICKGKKGKRRCKAHDTGGCAAGAQTVGCGTDVACTASSGKPGQCVTTTGNAGYCAANIGGGGSGYGQGCKTDFDCQVVAGGLFGPTAACVRCNLALGGTVCAAADELEIM